MDRLRLRLWLVLLLVLLAACAPATRPAASQTTAGAPAAAPERLLTVGVRVEPATIAAKPLRSAFVKVKLSARLFNAGLDLIDDQNVARPYMAEALPRLNSDSWRVLPDGRMETSYTLKPNLTWHDGAPLTADDFLFAWQVYSTPDLGTAGSLPFSAMENVTAPDAKTVLIHWKRPYPYAGVLQASGDAPHFPAMPRHLLDAQFREAQWEAFTNSPYWTSEFVGSGPFRLERWEPGVSIEGAAFAGHVLGRPKIDRVRIIFMSDANSALASLLSGAIVLAADDAMGFEQGVTVKREWASTGGGSFLVTTDLWRAVYFQFRPEVATPPGILDARVRKALAHSIDKQILNETLYAGEGIMAEMILAPGVDYYPTVAQSITTYPYDLRQADQLMTDAGYRKGADGFYARPDEGRFAPELKVNASVQYENERSVVASGWRQAGIDFQEATLPASQAQDPVLRATFPALYAFSTGVGERALPNFASNAIPKPENRWTGNNREGWISPAFDRLVDRLGTALDPTDRVQTIGQMAQILTDELPAISLYYDLGAVAHTAALQGPRRVGPDTSGLVAWNVHEWELR